MSQHADSHAQPAPTGTGQSVTDAVIADMQFRREQGTAKYGTELKTNNGRDALTDAYQEALDLVMYLKQQLLERDFPQCSMATPPGACGECPECLLRVHNLLAQRVGAPTR